MGITRLLPVCAMSFLAFAAAGEERVHLETAADGTIGDQVPYDGFPDSLFENSNNVAFRPSSGDLRAVMHFDISNAKGLVVQRATLKLDMISKEHSQATVVPIEVRGYASGGVLRLKDFHRGTFVTVVDADATPFGLVTIDVTDRVRAVLSSPHSYIGFTLRTNADSVTGFQPSNVGGQPPELVIVTP